ncbi:heterokaryon incompatibility protein-domain-containing protein, partial [Bisporella sp. PMI_857]
MAIKYSPIDDEIDIRLVKLEPGNSTDPIYCTLRSARFSANPQYQALSYTWGKATDGFNRIYIDSETVEVRANLYEALKSLRPPLGPERNLWIDSLCINQADDQERSQQVGRMSEIYSQAGEVLI